MGIPRHTNMQNLCLLACIVCASMMQAHAGGPLTISFSSGDSTIGVYYIGNETALSAGDISAQKVDMEILAGELGPNKQMMHTSYFDHAFVVRSSNMHFRAKVAVYKNTDEAQKYPYTCSFALACCKFSINSPSADLSFSVKACTVSIINCSCSKTFFSFSVASDATTSLFK